MSKLIVEPIKPSLAHRGNYPRSFRWRGRFYRITDLGGAWAEAGRWWEGQTERKFLRVLTDRNVVADLCFEPKRAQWLLYRVYD
ncbi:MAG TPA: DUF6504 family protein [Armatimonadota bacterium]